MLAAEYVLGVIERREASAIEAMAKDDPELAAAIVAWQDRLAPLAQAVPPHAAPDELWTRLEDAIAPKVVSIAAAKPKPRGLARAWHNTGFWRGTTAGALALAAAVAGLAIVHNPPRPMARAIYVADLAPTGASADVAPHVAAMPAAPAGTASTAAAEAPPRGAQPFAQSASELSGSMTNRFQPAAATPAPPAPNAPGSALAPPQPAAEPTPQPPAEPPAAQSSAAAARFMVASMPDGSLMVKPMGAVAVGAGKDLELWALPPGAQRALPLGVLPAGGLHVAMANLLHPNTRLMVSLEPQGGSPTGQPTGPVLYSGALTRVE